MIDQERMMDPKILEALGKVREALRELQNEALSSKSKLQREGIMPGKQVLLGLLAETASTANHSIMSVVYAIRDIEQ